MTRQDCTGTKERQRKDEDPESPGRLKLPDQDMNRNQRWMILAEFAGKDWNSKQDPSNPSLLAVQRLS
jgi:hypothetical protein